MKKYGTILLSILVVIALLLWFGKCQQEKGKREAAAGQKTAVIDTHVTQWQDSANTLRINLNDALRERDALKSKNEGLLHQLSTQQKDLRSNREQVTTIIKSEPDSVKDKEIDSIQQKDKTGLLSRYSNYPSMEKSLSNCEQETSVLRSTIKSDSTTILKGERYTVATDSLMKWKDAKLEDVTTSAKKVRRGKNFWIFTGWGLAISQTALFVYEGVKNTFK